MESVSSANPRALTGRWEHVSRCRLLCWLLPMSEIVLAALLFSGTLLPWAALGGGGLFVVFSLAVSINLVRGRRNAQSRGDLFVGESLGDEP